MLVIILAVILFVPMAVAPLFKSCKQEDKTENTVDKTQEEVYSAYCKHFS